MPSTFVQWIDRQGWFHATIRKLRLRAVVSQILRIFPFTRRYSSGTRVRVSDLESFFLSDEIFRRETYKNALAGAGAVHTVVDLGCNVGYFGCYLRHYFGSTEFCGLGIDANPALLKLARRNLDLNDLGEIKLLNGLVGASNESSSRPFYVYASHLGSSQFIQPESGRTIKGGWRKIFVPVLKVSKIWIEKYGDVPIDLLKVDIEGSEGKLLLWIPIF